MGIIKYRTKLKIDKFFKNIKSNIITFIMNFDKEDVADFIVRDIHSMLKSGNEHIIISMCGGNDSHNSITDYLAKYHGEETCWDINFLHIAFDVISERIERKLSLYKDVNVEVLSISETDRRVIVTYTK